MIAAYTLKAVDDYTDADKSGIHLMKEAVYPPEQLADAPGRRREWLRPGWGVLVTVDGQVVSHTGIVLTEADVNGVKTTIGGVGGIATDPEHRGKGYAGRSIDMAVRWLQRQGAGFALLVCRDALVPYYSSLGWEVFEGDLRVTQFGKPETFTFNNVMVRAAFTEVPSDGVIDLDGPPW